MAEQLNKLGKVLVYDSSVDLQDRSAGGKGFQSVTLDSAGAYITGTVRGKTLHILNADGTPEENGQALIDIYAKAKEASVEEVTYNLPIDGSLITGRDQGYGTIGDPTVPFTGYGYGNDGGFAIPTLEWNPSETFESGMYLTMTLVDVNGTKCEILADMSSKFVSSFWMSVDRINSGTAFPMEDLATIIYTRDVETKQHLVLAPGEYLLPNDLLLDAAVDISTADGARSAIIDGDYRVKYALPNSSLNTVTISGLNCYDNNVRFEMVSGAKFATIINCSGGQYSFCSDGGSHQNHTFKDCHAQAYSFASSSANCNSLKFYNCSADGNSFGYACAQLNNSYFYDCVSNSNSFLYQTSSCTGTIFYRCTKNGTNGFAGMPSKVSVNWSGDILFKDCVDNSGRGFCSNVTLPTNVRLVFDGCYTKSNYVFGWGSDGGSHSNVKFINCSATYGSSAFGQNGLVLKATMINCTAFTSSAFQNGTNVSLKLIGCTSAQGQFNSIDTGNFGKIVQCIDNNNNLRNIV